GLHGLRRRADRADARARACRRRRAQRACRTRAARRTRPGFHRTRSHPMIKKQKGLGRGLEALLGADTSTARPAAEGEAIHALRLDQLQAGRYQPRTRMDETALQELAASIREHGLMQPIVVRPAGAGRWEIIAGERRFRAAGLAGLVEVPVIVREVPDEQALQLALIENIQREDLNPLEEAQAIRRLID